MPTLSTISSDDKTKIKTAVAQSDYKILTATLARVYYAAPDPSSWSYAGMQGALVFARVNSSGGFTFKLVDLQGTRGVIWEHELYEPFDYNQDRPFFHSFAGDVRKPGLSASRCGWLFACRKLWLASYLLTKVKQRQCIRRWQHGRLPPVSCAEPFVPAAELMISLSS